MSRPPGTDQSLLGSYLALRRAIGIIGVSLPFVLALGNMILEGQLEIKTSVSSYYYSGMRDVFVGSLCAIGVFLMFYRGYGRIDNIAGNFACVFALAVAWFPVKPPHGAGPQEIMIGHIHVISAAGLFLILAFFSLKLFRKRDRAKASTRRKTYRNAIYAICGATILVCIAFIAVLESMPGSPVKIFEPVFWLESIAVVAFGISWLTKGESILRDKRIKEPPPAQE